MLAQSHCKDYSTQVHHHYWDPTARGRTYCWSPSLGGRKILFKKFPPLETWLESSSHCTESTSDTTVQSPRWWSWRRAVLHRLSDATPRWVPSYMVQPRPAEIKTPSHRPGRVSLHKQHINYKEAAEVLPGLHAFTLSCYSFKICCRQPFYKEG